MQPPYPKNSFLCLYDKWNPKKVIHKIPLYREHQAYAESQKIKWMNIISEQYEIPLERIEGIYVVISYTNKE